MNTTEMNVKELNMAELKNAAGGSASYGGPMVFKDDCMTKEAQTAFWINFLSKNKGSMTPALNLKYALALHSTIHNSLLTRNEVIQIAIEFYGKDALGL